MLMPFYPVSFCPQARQLNAWPVTSALATNAMQVANSCRRIANSVALLSAFVALPASAIPQYYTFEGTVSSFSSGADVENSTIAVGASVAYTLLIDTDNPGVEESPSGDSITGEYYARFVSGALLYPADIDPTVDLSDATRSYFGVYTTGADNGFVDNRISLDGSELHLIELYGLGDITTMSLGDTASLYERYKKPSTGTEPRYQASVTLLEVSSNDTSNALPVTIDIKPSSFPNSINLSAQGVTPVAILGSAELDVSLIDWNSLSLGTAGIKTVGKKDKQLCSLEDVSGDYSAGSIGVPDGYTDLVCQFTTFSIVPEEGGTSATLRGVLMDETPIEGGDLVNIVP
jgi:hypothetical protein